MLNELFCSGFGPVSRKSNEAVKILRKSIDTRITKLSITRPPKEYENMDKAISARMKAVSTYPGNQSISYEAAKAIITRGINIRGTIR